MTISDTATKFRYEGNASTDTFAFSGKAFTAADLVVEIITRATDVLEETLTITTDYSVTIATDGTASIVTVAGKIPSATQDIQIRRALAQTQTVSLPTGSKFPAKSVETAIDRAVGLSQDLEEAVDRSMKFPATSSTTVATLPEPTDDATIAFDGTTGTFKVGPTTSAISAAATDAAAAAASAAAALTSENNSATSETNAAASEAAAAASELAAAASEATVVNEWTFDSSTSMADPGAGDIRLNNATLGSVTAIAIAATSADTGTPDLSDYIATWGDSTNAVKGYITIRDASAPQNFALYSVGAAVTDNTTWLQITVTHVASNGTLAGGQKIHFTKAGDVGSISTINQDIDMNSNQMQWSKGADVASATALPILTDGNYFDVTGTTTVTSIDTTGTVGTVIKLHFDAALTLTHHATDLILPSGANITTAAGDEAEFIEYAAGDFRCTNYSKADGTSVVSAGGGGAWNLIETQVASASASINFTTSIDSTYALYVVAFEDVIPATDGQQLKFRVSTDTGSSYLSANYKWGDTYVTNSTAGAIGSVSDNSVNLNGANGVGSGTGESCAGSLFIANPSNSSLYKQIKTYVTSTDSATNLYSDITNGAYTGATTAIDAFQFLFASGNITSGRFTLYGIAHA